MKSLSQHTPSRQLPEEEDSRQQAYFREHPPTSLGGYRTRPATLENVEFDGHGEAINPLHEILCLCGSPHHRLTLRPTGAVTHCAICTHREVMIGYADGDWHHCQCTDCGSVNFALVQRVEYPSDLLGNAERPEDGFTWFTTVGTCVTCGKVAKLVDLETG